MLSPRWPSLQATLPPRESKSLWVCMARDEKRLQVLKFEKQNLPIYAKPHSIIKIILE